MDPGHDDPVDVQIGNDGSKQISLFSVAAPPEIYTEKDGGVIFRKYSPMGEFQEFAEQMCQSMGSNLGRIAAISDRDAVIALAGAPKRELMDKPNSRELETLMEQRKSYRYTPGNPRLPAAQGQDKYFLAAAAPIVSQGDLMGCVMLLSTQEEKVEESDQKLVQTVAGFLGLQMES